MKMGGIPYYGAREDLAILKRRKLGDSYSDI